MWFIDYRKFRFTIKLVHIQRNVGVESEILQFMKADVA